MAVKGSVEIVDPSGILHKDMWGEITKQLRADAQELADLEVYNVTKRTPELTGALRADITGEANPNKKTLAYIYSGTDNQLMMWDRVYVLYQEGGQLGLGSNIVINGVLHGNHQMYQRATTDDIPDIEAWGRKSLQSAANNIVKGGTP